MNDLARWTSSLPAEWIEGCSDSIFTSAHESYQSPGRFYHGWSHVVACVDTLRTFPCDSPRSVFLALLFHDAIYVAGNAENESESAELATRLLMEHSTLGKEKIAAIHRMILATREHRLDAADSSRDLGVTLDIDMSILAAPWEQYTAYARGVRDEYCPAVTTEARFIAGRIAFLSKVLASPSIFHTPEGVARWEAGARANISRELRDLESQQEPFWRAVTAVVRLIRSR